MTTIPKPTGTDAPADEAEVSDEELKFVIPGDRRIEAANAITTRSMARRLPQLIRRSLALGWQVDRAAVIALLGVQILSGVLEAFGLMPMSGEEKERTLAQRILVALSVIPPASQRRRSPRARCHRHRAAGEPCSVAAGG